MDDLVLFGDDRGDLRAAHGVIAGWLAEHRRLTLHPGHVVETAEPCAFLGYRVSRAGLAPGKKLRRRLPERVRRERRDARRFRARGRQVERSRLGACSTNTAKANAPEPVRGLVPAPDRRA